MYDALVAIGRYQPYHDGHHEVLKQALSMARHVIVVLGSDGTARNVRNPFTTSERAVMISESFNSEDNKRLHFLPQRDYPYNLDRWFVSVRAGVAATVTSIYGFRDDSSTLKIGIIGHVKDETSFYVKAFQGWDVVEVNNYLALNATDVREDYFSDQGYKCNWSKNVPPSTYKFLLNFTNEKAYANLVEEQGFINRYKQAWAAAPYPPTFLTADTVVVQNACVLMVKRRDNPGKGLWALPGGFVNQKESIRDAAIRELKEETKIKVYKDVLIGSIEKEKIFDDPYRSQRGRTVTTAFLIKLKDGKELPEVKGSDDAEVAKWIPLDQLKRDQIFEDHFDIIETMLGI